MSKLWRICAEKGNDLEHSSKMFIFVSIWVILEHDSSLSFSSLGAQEKAPY